MRAARGWVWALALLLAGGCSLVLDFDPEGQPCDAQGACAEGYVCRAGSCVRPATADGGEDFCASCPEGATCTAEARSCGMRCGETLCAPGTACSQTPEGYACVALAATAPGGACDGDAACAGLGPEWVCLRSAVAEADGGEGSGLCVAPCEGPNAPCAAPGTRCEGLGPQGRAPFVCLVPDAVRTCTTPEACGGLTCTVFAHSALGPAQLCDAPLAGGAAAGEVCGPTGAPPACASGLCVGRQEASGEGTCGQLCEEGSCQEGTTCLPVELPVAGGVRHLPMCVPGPTHCADCTDSPAACGADAPHCSTLGERLRCLAACSPEAGVEACPSGRSCQQVGEDFRCVPSTGVCL